jgi:hypothetical protein
LSHSIAVRNSSNLFNFAHFWESFSRQKSLLVRQRFFKREIAHAQLAHRIALHKKEIAWGESMHNGPRFSAVAGMADDVHLMCI